MTKIFHIQSSDIDMKQIKEAAQLIQKDGIVAFPTETVYGLGANGLEVEAVKKIFIAKGRPSDNPLILHISNTEMLGKLVEEIPPKAKLLIEKMWPGPLTLIFKRSPKVPDVITGGLDTVAIRMPSHPIAQSLIKESNVPIAAPSANISGKPSTTTAEHVMEDLNGKVDGIIASDHSTIGLESTVLDITEETPILLRPGGITIEEIQAIIGEIKVDPGILHGSEVIKAKSPGMKYKHYAPKAPVKVIKGEIQRVINKINALSQEYESKGKKVGVLATEESKEKYHAYKVVSLGQRTKPESIMNNLFDCLREFDKWDIDIILSEGFSDTGKELAISNRLNKAAGYDIIKL